MSVPAFYVLDVCLLASEMTLALSRRAGESGTDRGSADQGSLRLLWIVITSALTAGHIIGFSGIGPYVGPYAVWRWSGIGVFVAGLLLRRWAIRHLGRFFTVDVAIASDQRVVSDGPYRYVRHPTYSGLMLEFAGIGLTLYSVTALVVIVVPTFLALLHRVRVEEAALVEGLGSSYRTYMSRTRRFVPGVI